MATNYSYVTFWNFFQVKYQIKLYFKTQKAEPHGPAPFSKGFKGSPRMRRPFDLVDYIA